MQNYLINQLFSWLIYQLCRSWIYPTRFYCGFDELNPRFHEGKPPMEKGNSHTINLYGWGGRVRTFECGIQIPVPYHLATPQTKNF